MGNTLCQKQQPKNRRQEEKPQVKVQIINKPPSQKIVTQPLVHTQKDQRLKELNDIGNQNFSFLPNNEENVSFVLYGEEISKLRKTFLKELNEMENLTLRLTKQDLLLLTQDNDDIRKILQNRNIDPHALFNSQDKNLVNMSLNQQFIPQQDEFLEKKDLPDFLKNKYNKMVQKSFLNSKQLSKKFLNTSFLQEDLYTDQIQEFLENQNDISQDRKVDLWNPDKHELVLLPDMNKYFHTDYSKNINQELTKVAQKQNLKFNKSKVLHQNLPVMTNPEYKIEDLEVQNFQDKEFAAALLGLMNYDQQQTTSLIRRILYPQENGLPIRSEFDIYLVKVNMNGARRALAIQCIENEKLTKNYELYPNIIYKAVTELYKNKKNRSITNIIYRLADWIPEIIQVTDIGNSATSFSKLQENFNTGHLIIFFDDPITKVIRPILSLEKDKKSNKHLIKTTSINYDKDFIYEDWDYLYNNQRIENLIINWNPTIYSYRKSIHFSVPLKFEQNESIFYQPQFQVSQWGQILLTLSPHKEQLETRLILEKHRNKLNINFKIKYYLYHFYNSRKVILGRALKETEIYESVDEIISDLIVFDQNNSYENYILAFELQPENPQDLQRIPQDMKQVLTLSYYSFCDFQIVEIPFKKIDGYSKMSVFYQSENNSSNDYPHFKFTSNYFGYFEIRLQGNHNIYYTIQIYKYQNFKNNCNSNQYLKSTLQKSIGVNQLCTKLDTGTYVVQIIPSLSPQDIPFSQKNSEYIPRHEITVHFISYSEELVQTFEQHIPSTEIFTMSQLQRKFLVEQIDLQHSFKYKKVFKGSWNPSNDYGTMKAKVDCYQKFMKNPGYLVTITEETIIKLFLKASGGEKQVEPTLAVSIYKITEDFKFYPVLDDIYCQGQVFESDEFILQANTQPYLILCFNLQEGWDGHFELTISSNNKLKNIKDNQKGIFKLGFENKPLQGLLPMGSGGHLKSPTFLFNPVYSLIIENHGMKNQQVTLFIELEFHSKEIPCSLYFYNTPKQSLFDLEHEEIQNADYNPAFLYEVNSLHKKVTPGHYLIVPSTLQPTPQSISYTLKIQCSSKFKLSSLNFNDFPTSFTLNIKNQKNFKIPFKINKPCKVLIILVPATTEIYVNTSLRNQNNQQIIFNKQTHLTESFLHKSFYLDNINTIYSYEIQSDRVSGFKVEISSQSKDSLHILQ